MFLHTANSAFLTILSLSLLGALAAVVVAAITGRVAMKVPVHKGLILGMIAILVFHGVSALMIKLLPH